MLNLARAIVGVLSDVLEIGVMFLRSSSAIRAENLVLRRQLARYIERGIKAQRVDHATRVSLSVFCRLFNWRDHRLQRLQRILLQPQTGNAQLLLRKAPGRQQAG